MPVTIAFWCRSHRGRVLPRQALTVPGFRAEWSTTRSELYEFVIKASQEVCVFESTALASNSFLTSCLCCSEFSLVSFLFARQATNVLQVTRQCYFPE